MYSISYLYLDKQWHPWNLNLTRQLFNMYMVAKWLILRSRFRQLTLNGAGSRCFDRLFQTIRDLQTQECGPGCDIFWLRLPFGQSYRNRAYSDERSAPDCNIVAPPPQQADDTPEETTQSRSESDRALSPPGAKFWRGARTRTETCYTAPIGTDGKSTRQGTQRGRFKVGQKGGRRLGATRLCSPRLRMY